MSATDEFALSRVEAERLAEDYERFRESAERVERAYTSLSGRVEKLDRELATSHEALEAALRDRERILGELPIAVFRRVEGVLRSENARAEDLARRVDDCALRAIEDRLEVVDREGTRLVLRTRAFSTSSGKDLELYEDLTRVEELRDEVARLDQLGAVAELALGVAHEVRNPLNAALGYATMLERRVEDAQSAGWTGKIVEGLRRVDRIVADLLAFARPDGIDSSDRKRLDEWFAEARVEAQGLELVFVDDAADRCVTGSRLALGKVFANLVRNAREADATKIEVRAEPAAVGSRVSVRDDGKGVDPSLAARIFEPFVGSKGSGLGLAFCARAMQAMGGSIRLAAAQSDGATFELEFSE